jgi:hypothetical protein
LLNVTQFFWGGFGGVFFVIFWVSQIYWKALSFDNKKIVFEEVLIDVCMNFSNFGLLASQFIQYFLKP